MAFTKAEQETIIRWDNETDTVEIYTSCKVVAKKLEQLAKDFPSTYHIKSKDKYGCVTCETAKKYISFRKPKKVSAEQLENLRNNMAKNRRNTA